MPPIMGAAACAGSGIAQSDPRKTGPAAFQLEIAGYIIPFMIDREFSKDLPEPDYRHNRHIQSGCRRSALPAH